MELVDTNQVIRADSDDVGKFQTTFHGKALSMPGKEGGEEE